MFVVVEKEIKKKKMFFVRQTKTVPVPLHENYERKITEIMKKYPVFDFNTDDFNAKAFISVDVKLNNSKARPSLIKEITDLWLPEIVAHGRWYSYGYGLIPYKFHNGPYGKKVPKLKRPKTGTIYTHYNVTEGENKYFWVSYFEHENTARFKSDGMMFEMKYDPKTHIYVVNGKSPDHDGTFNSKISKLVPDYNDVMLYRKLSVMRDKKIAKDPMVIEEILPNNNEQLKYMSNIGKVVLNEQSEQDLRQIPDEAIETTGQGGMQINRTNTTRQYHIHGDYCDRFEWPDRKDMSFKLLPGQKYHDYKVQNLQSSYELKREEFERMLSTSLGSVFKPWERDVGHRSISDAYLVNAQTFVVTSTKNELKIYSGLLLDWILKLYGEPFYKLYKYREFLKNLGSQRQKIVFNRMKRTRTKNGIRNNEHLRFLRKPPVRLGKRKRMPKRDDDYSKFNNQLLKNPKKRKIRKITKINRYKMVGKILSDREIKFLRGILDLKVEIARKGTMVRPGFDEIDRMFYAGRINPKTFADLYSDYLGVSLDGNITPEELFIATMKRDGEWVDKRALAEELKVKHNLSKQMMMQQQLQQQKLQQGQQRPRQQQQQPGGRGGQPKMRRMQQTQRPQRQRPRPRSYRGRPQQRQQQQQRPQRQQQQRNRLYIRKRKLPE
jgi:hypothetical protein